MYGGNEAPRSLGIEAVVLIRGNRSRGERGGGLGDGDGNGIVVAGVIVVVGRDRELKEKG